MKKKKRSRFFSKLAKLVRDETGSPLLEATLLTPVLLILFLGVFEFSYVFYQQQLIEIGVRDAARYLSRTSLGDPCATASMVTNAKNLATRGSINPSAPPRVCTGGTCWDAADVGIGCIQNGTGGPYLLPDGSTGSAWIVTVSTSFLDPSFGTFSFLGLARPNISFAHSERSNGPELIPIAP